MKVPSLLNVPDKMIPFVKDFDKYRVFVIEGGRGSAKTQTVARMILYLMLHNEVRVLCGREIQSSIDDSVHAVFADLIEKYKLDLCVKRYKIAGSDDKSRIIFKGFRQQGNVNIKGTEGVDICWIDEAESITNDTLEKLSPTIRKNNSVLIFTLNRFMIDDPVYERYVGRPDCLHININYYDNQFATQATLSDAAECKRRSIKEYNRVWLGQPLESASDLLFNYERLDNAKKLELSYGLIKDPPIVIGFDVALQGDDDCCAAVLQKKTSTQWEAVDIITWSSPTANDLLGRITKIINEYKPTCSTLDVGGMGSVVWSLLTDNDKKPIQNMFRFDGGSNKLASRDFLNHRAEAYYKTSYMIDDGELKIPDDLDTIKELRSIKVLYRADMKKQIVPKIKIKSEIGRSPDRADAIAMAVWCIIKHLNNVIKNVSNNNMTLISTTGVKNRRGR